MEPPGKPTTEDHFRALPEDGAAVPYEDHIVRSDTETTMVGGLFEAMEEITKGAVGLTKGTAEAFVELGHELTRDAGGARAGKEDRGQDVPTQEDRPIPEEDRDALARRARADLQWAEIVRGRAQEQDRDLER